MQMIESTQLFNKLNDISEYTWASLHQLKLDEPDIISDIRGLGAMLGVELHSEAFAKLIKSTMMNMPRSDFGLDGFVVKTTRGKTLRLSLNSCMTKDDIDYFVRSLRQIFF